MTITAEKVMEDACQMYRELCQAWLANRESEWPEICRDKSEVDLTKGIVVLRSSESRYLRQYHYRHDEYSMWEPEICRECQEPILDCYLAKDDLWRQSGYGPLDLVCAECLEKKVGRRLVSRDFVRMRRHPSKERRWVRGVRLVSDGIRKILRDARQKILCQDKVIAWMRASRFRLVRKLVGPYAGRKLLDYGCGDGTFLAWVHDLFPEAVGADADPKQTTDCAKRFTETTGLSFVLRDELVKARHDGAYGLVICTNVLEHCLEQKWDAMLSDLSRLAAPDGTILISTPIESGPSLIIKQFIRTVAGWRGLGPETYTIAQFWKMVFAGKGTTIDRPVYRAESVPERWKLFHGHKGFNWRKLRARIDAMLAVEHTCFWPLSWSGGYFNGQAWFICKPRRLPQRESP